MTTNFPPPPPESYTPLHWVLFNWKHSLKRDYLARQYFESSVSPQTIERRLGGYPLTLYESAQPGKAPELFLSSHQCAALRNGLAESMGPTRANQSWNRQVDHPWQALDASTGGAGITAVMFYSFQDLERRMGDLRRVADHGVTAKPRRELDAMRALWRRAPAARPNFIALDVETWEMDHDELTEFGWSVRTSSGEVYHEHAIVEENMRRRNGRYCPDARDCFDFGTSTIIPEAALLAKLRAEFRQLSATQALFLILHAPKADLEALQLLGMNTDDFISTLPQQGVQPTAGQIYVCDTQELFTGWQGQRRKEKLLTCCAALGVDTTGARPHNAGNDAVFTRLAFEAMMERDRLPGM